MPKFVSRKGPSPRAPARYLAPIRKQVQDELVRYRQSHPDGEDFTLAVLVALGEDEVRALGSRGGANGQKALDNAKKAIGYLVAVELTEMPGIADVLTERLDDGKTAYSRPNVSGVATWVTSYTRHRVLP